MFLLPPSCEEGEVPYVGMLDSNECLSKDDGSKGCVCAKFDAQTRCGDQADRDRMADVVALEKCMKSTDKNCNDLINRLHRKLDDQANCGKRGPL